MTALVKPHQKGPAQPANADVAITRRYDGYGNRANFIRPQWGLFTTSPRESKPFHTGLIRERCTVALWSATLNPMEANDELFYVEETRSVRKDNTFSILAARYEAPRDLADRVIHVRYNRANPDRIVVYYKGERMGEATRLDFLANDRPPAPCPPPTQPSAITPAKPFENQP